MVDTADEAPLYAVFHPSVAASISCPLIPLSTLRGLDNRGSIAVRDARFFSTLCCPGRLRGQPSLLSKRYRLIFRGCKADLAVELTTHLHLMPTSRMVELYFHSLIRVCLHGAVLG
jgi:hypothetical protein